MSRTAVPTRTPAAILVLGGPAQLLVEGQQVKLRSKGLALLYYLALEGPTRRERLAHLLWGHGGALGNLRVELHRLRSTLAAHGVEPLALGADPLKLAGIAIQHEAVGQSGVQRHELMIGLDDVSPEYQAWLDTRRAMTSNPAPSSVRQDLIAALAREIAHPYLLILSGEPGSGRRRAARDLARVLGLPFVDGNAGSGPALRYVAPDTSDRAGLAPVIEGDDQSVWVLARSAFGEDDELVLRLRAAIPASRLRFQELEPMTWGNAKVLLPPEVGFEEGARLYLASCGNPRYLDELVTLRSKGRSGAEIPVPQRMRAAYALESRRLSPPARFALEAMSVHDSPLTFELLAAEGSIDHLDELERQGWLRYLEGAWWFRSELTRRMLLEQLPEGTRNRLRAGTEPATPPRPGNGVGQRAAGALLGSSSKKREATEPVPTVKVQPGVDVWIDEMVGSGSDIDVAGDTISFARVGLTGASSGLSLHFETASVLLHVAGRCVLGASGRGPQPGSAHALTVEATTLAPGAGKTPVAPDVISSEIRRLVVPLESELNFWILARSVRRVDLRLPDARAVVELTIRSYEPELVGVEASEGSVEAFVLDGYGRKDSVARSGDELTASPATYSSLAGE